MLDQPILHIEASGPMCSLALSEGPILMDQLNSSEEKKHIGEMAVLVKNLLLAHQVSSEELSAISLSAGPGSYTGLRVAYALVKGLMHGLSTPILNIPTYETLQYGDLGQHGGISTVILHARKDEYILYKYDQSQQYLGQEEILYNQLLIRASKFEVKWISDQRINGIQDLKIVPRSAINLIKPAYNRYQNQQFELARNISPIYYKPPYITTRKTKLI